LQPEADLPRSANREHLLAQVDVSLRELEHLCGTLEKALMRRRWPDMDQAIAESRRATHALQNAMEAASVVRDQAFDDHVLQRLRHVQAIRQNQMARLQQYNDAVRERLQLIARWKSALKNMSGSPKTPPPAVVDRAT
jgi:hypothetical protein